MAYVPIHTDRTLRRGRLSALEDPRGARPSDELEADEDQMRFSPMGQATRTEPA